MLYIRTATFGKVPPKEFEIDFNKNTITTGGKTYNLIKINCIGIPYEFVALVYDADTGRNFYLDSEGKKIVEMKEK